MKRQLKAFTLVELLVVIGIIAVLISILLPSLNRVRWQANITACGARMHDIMNAIQMYANDNKQAIPPYPGDTGVVGNYNVAKANYVAGTVYQFSDVSASGAMTLDGPSGTPPKPDNGAQLGRLWKTRYLRTSQSLYCPANKNINPLAPPQCRDFNNYYTYNCNFKYVDAAATVAQVWWKKLNGYGKPSTGQYVDFYYGGIARVLAVAPPVWTRPILMDPIFEYEREGDKGNVTHLSGNRRAYNCAYADGHVTTVVNNNYLSRPGANAMSRLVNLSNAIGAAAGGAPIDLSNGSWAAPGSATYYAVPVMPN